MKQETYKISGMSCASCSAAVERVTRKLDGVSQSDVNLTTERMTITYDETKVTPEQITAKVEKAGFGIELITPEKGGKLEDYYAIEDDAKEKLRVIFAAFLSALIMLISMGLMDRAARPMPLAIAELALATAVLIIGRKYFISGYKSLFHLNPNMDSLVAIGCSCSYIYSLVMTVKIPQTPGTTPQLYYESAAVVLTLIMLGKFMESRSKRKTKAAITALIQLVPQQALMLLVTEGESIESAIRKNVVAEIDTEHLEPGQVVLVKTGMRIPADGMVVYGTASVDESMLTGESLPVAKTIGGMVTGGSVNQSGTLYVRLERTGKDTTLAGIIRLVEEAQGHKAPISRLADHVAGIFVPVVMAIAVVAFVIWMIAGAELAFALKVFTSVLVVACPCSLGLATPTAIMVGTGIGAGRGILLRSGEALETIGRADTAVLDKTGTITTGQLKVREIVAAGADAADMIARAAAVESFSNHPLAKAIACAGGEVRSGEFKRKIRPDETLSHLGTPNMRYSLESGSFRDHPGLGTEGTVIGHYMDGSGAGTKEELCRYQMILGNQHFMEERNVDVSMLAAHANRLSAQGAAIVYVACDGAAQGLIALADELRESSSQAIARLKGLGLRVIMLSGDSSAAAEHIGRQAGVDEIVSQVMPDQKAIEIQKLQKAGHRVIMIGDGINDAPALAQADIGVAIGGGSDVAVESGDVVLMKSDIMDVAEAIKLSRITLKTIKQNLFWAFFYNTIGIPIAAGVLFPAFGFLLNPMIAGLAMSCSSICVVSNALLIHRRVLKGAEND